MYVLLKKKERKKENGKQLIIGKMSALSAKRKY